MPPLINIEIKPQKEKINNNIKGLKILNIIINLSNFLIKHFLILFWFLPPN